jgi:hypothetical protein
MDTTQPPSLPEASETPPIEVAPEIAVPVPPSPNTPIWTKLNRPVFLLPVFALLIISTGTAYFVTRATWMKKPQPPITVKIMPTSVPPQLFLTLVNPQNGDGVVDGEILVSGKTLPGATVAIFTGSDQVIVDTDATGVFNQTVVLDPDISTLTVTAFSDDGQEQMKSVDIQQT